MLAVERVEPPAPGHVNKKAEEAGFLQRVPANVQPMIGSLEVDNTMFEFSVPVYFVCQPDGSDKDERLDEAKRALESVQFQEWIVGMNNCDQIVVTALLIQNVIVDPKSKAIESVKLTSQCFKLPRYRPFFIAHRAVAAANTDQERQAAEADLDAARKNVGFVPGICFLRPMDAVVLVVVKTQKGLFTLVTEGPCVAAAEPALVRLPTGRFEGSVFTGEAAALIQKHLPAITLNAMNMTDLTRLTYGHEFPGVVPSGGGCSVFVRLLLREIMVDHKEFLKQKEALEASRPVSDEGGVKLLTTLRVIPLNDLWKTTPDMCSLSAYSLYQRLKGAHVL